MRNRQTLTWLVLILAATSALFGSGWPRADAGEPAGLRITAPQAVKVFDYCELQIEPRGEIAAVAALPETQIHDAYDADRDGRFVRFSAQFTHEAGSVKFQALPCVARPAARGNSESAGPRGCPDNGG